MILAFYHTILTFNNSVEETFGKFVGKRENAGNQHFLFFLLDVILIYGLQNTFNFGYSKILLLIKELSHSLSFLFSKFNALTHSHTMTPFDAPGKQAF